MVGVESVRRAGFNRRPSGQHSVEWNVEFLAEIVRPRVVGRREWLVG